jgi:hypothetical protein
MRKWILTIALVAVVIFLIASHIIQWRQGTLNHGGGL